MVSYKQFWIKDDLHAKIKSKSAKEGVSMQELVRKMIENEENDR